MYKPLVHSKWILMIDHTSNVQITPIETRSATRRENRYTTRAVLILL